MELFKKYKDAKEFLFKQLPMYQRQGPKAFKKDLKNIRFLLDKLGNPQTKLKAVHVAGTNGKGSTSHFIAALFRANGLEVGIYTSPHYKSYRERIKINGNYIPKSYVLNFVNKLGAKGLFDQEEIKPSFFEITVALAFDYFASQELDVVVIETGLGGRLDSTNVLNPLVSVITNISLDHTNFLGDTVEQIASEKAGIIKPNRPVIIGKDQHECQFVFKDKAAALNATLYYAEQLVDLILIDKSIKGNSYLYRAGGNNIVFKTKVTGDFQLENIRTALCTALIISQVYNLPFDGKKSLKKAFLKTLTSLKYIGRFQVMNEHPLVVLDSAHNPEGISKVFEELKSYKFRKKRIVFGAVNDKDLTMTFKILDKEAKYYLCEAKIPRAMKVKDLADAFAYQGLDFKIFHSVRKAYSAAIKDASSEDLILVTGSIFVAAELV